MNLITASFLYLTRAHHNSRCRILLTVFHLVVASEASEAQPPPVVQRSSVHSRLGKRPLGDQQQPEDSGAPEEGQTKRRIARLPVLQDASATLPKLGDKSIGKLSCLEELL